jgi:hypothetical protein
LDTGLWTSDAGLGDRKFGVACIRGTCADLHNLGFSVQRPRRVLARADAGEQDRWHRRIYPNLKKKPAPKAGR